jgi:hypothetical protein
MRLMWCKIEQNRNCNHIISYLFYHVKEYEIWHVGGLRKYLKMSYEMLPVCQQATLNESADDRYM